MLRFSINLFSKLKQPPIPRKGYFLHTQNEISNELLTKLCSYVNYLSSKFTTEPNLYIPINFLDFFGSGDRKQCIHTVHLINQVVTELKKRFEDFKEINTLCNSNCEAELKEVAKLEQNDITEKIITTKKRLINALLEINQHEYEADGTDCETILEVHAGVGGQEAMKFADELYNMYRNWCFHNDYDFHQLEYINPDSIGVSKAVATISGPDNPTIFNLLLNEGGVHRVQRVPVTEKRGRVHTSTASVALLRNTDNDIKIDEKELIIKPVRKAAGGGGQHVNKTESGIRVTHIPTGITLECVATRHQHLNREIALKRIAAKLAQKHSSENESELKKLRRQQIKNNARSDKIRTYNFHSDKVIDHRLGCSVTGVKNFLSARILFPQMMADVHEHSLRKQLNYTLEILLNEGKKQFSDCWSRDIIGKDVNYFNKL